MSELEIRDLLIRISLNEDRMAFKQIYFYFYEDMLKLARKFISCEDDAEEIVDDAFLKIWNNRMKLYQINNLKVYLFVCVRNLCFNYIEKTKRSPIVSIDDIQFEPQHFGTSPDTKLNLADLKGIINQAISQLTPQCRLVFKLVKEDGLKYREVAEVLNISTKTVEYHIGNALRQITERLSILSKQ
ncbi:RNA polymerase sigma-70 factor [Desertivirga arenae]|uniref:RNA polymerase sigma-70 factor n=1 Tax=Desertivirga arenae TaxID=2810309 RepID=UPI001A96C17A|nr:RNA polymerase sigma-70 factor [Pedobacter sp. SYSU D00823]